MILDNSLRKLDRSFLTTVVQVLWLVLILLLIMHVWIVDDAFITLRQVQQFVLGNGFVWNPGERVQAYTHPLWALLLIVPYWLTYEGFWTLTILSLIITVLGMFVACRWLDRSGEHWRKVIFIALLLPSKAFLDYTSSGLENCLTHAMLFVFFGAFWCWYDRSSRSIHLNVTVVKVHLLGLCFIAGLIYLNRADTLALVAPGMAVAILRSWCYLRWRAVLVVLVGFVPVILWTFWTLFYYGEIVPNTALAKIVGARLTVAERLHAGGLYFFDSLLRDPYTLVLCFAAIVSLLRSTGLVAKAAALGMLLYLFYVLFVGAAGTHMSGRFFSGVVALAAFAVARQSEWLGQWSPRSLVGLVIIASLITPFSPLRSLWNDTNTSTGAMTYNGIIDTRYHAGRAGSSLQSYTRGVTMPDHPWFRAGLEFSQHEKKVHLGGLGVADAVGFSGFAAGPSKFIIDRMGLTDPLLGRLPMAATDRLLRPGHILRRIPDGYLESCESGENRLHDPSLYAYYEAIRYITRGPLWSWDRLRTIFALKTGAYDGLLEDYSSRHGLRAER